MYDVMVDLETLGTVPGCVILSIGAVAFDEKHVAEDGFYKVVDRGNCEALGLHTDNDTLIWWSNQSEEARKVLMDPSALRLQDALGFFNNFLKQYADDRFGVRVWGNGADFDNAILSAAYRAVGWKCPFPFTGRCYRTVKNQYPDVKLVRGGTYHNALDDARSQADHLVRICQTHKWKLV